MSAGLVDINAALPARAPCKNMHGRGQSPRGRGAGNAPLSLMSPLPRLQYATATAVFFRPNVCTDCRRRTRRRQGDEHCREHSIRTTMPSATLTSTGLVGAPMMAGRMPTGECACEERESLAGQARRPPLVPCPQTLAPRGVCTLPIDKGREAKQGYLHYV